MSSDVTKRALSAGLGVGALALLAPRASADTPFSSFAFRATGAPTARTLPDRLGELKTVKDFGARGDGVADDTAAIQAAVKAGGRTFFPAGSYVVSRPIRNPSPERGSSFYAGNDVAIIAGFDGYVFDIQGDDTEQNTARFEGLYIANKNFSKGGGIRISRGANHIIHNCAIFANRPITFANGAWSSEVSNCFLRPGTAPPTSPVALSSVPGSIGVMMAGNPALLSSAVQNMSIRCVDLNSFDHGIRLAGACSMANIRAEICNVGIVVGLMEDGVTTYPSSAQMDHLEFEANGTHIWLAGAPYGVIINHADMLGDSGFSGDIIDGGEARIGIRVAEHSWVSTNMVTVEGYYRDASIKFEGVLNRSTFISTQVHSVPDPRPGSVYWRGVNLIGAGNATFIQCNQPPA